MCEQPVIRSTTMRKGENEEELWDVYDKDRRRTGKLHVRKNPLPEGEYHLVVHVCIFNSKNQMLVQQRQPWKKGWSNMWDLAVGGSAVAGDDSRETAERETLEEIGLKIDLTNVRPRFSFSFPDGYDDYYFVTKDFEIEELKLQEEEVQAVKWVNHEELMEMIDKGEMIPYFFLDKIFEIKDLWGSRFRRKH